MTWEGRRSRDDLSQSALYSLGSISTIFRPNDETQAELRALIEGSANSPGGTRHVTDNATDPDPAPEVLADIESRSRELIAGRLAHLDDNQMEQVVAGILRAMGYFTQTAPEHGADGGVDVLAARDALFVERPVVKVQVKQRSGKAVPANIRALAGVLDQDERGIFVSMGGFGGQMRENRAATRITLSDADRLQELLVEYYDRLDQDTKALVPLRRLYFPQD
jgi:restriction system protein